MTVSSWFIDQLSTPVTDIKRVFMMAGSDHGPRVLKWPTVRRSIALLKPVNVKITLDNVDGLYNDFYDRLYTIPASSYIEVGYTHPQSGDEMVRIYTGRVNTVTYPENIKCELKLQDTLYGLSLRKIGSPEAPASFGAQIPSDIAWTICTCYGGLSAVQDSSNINIDYPSYQEWSASFSADSVTAAAHYAGDVATTAIDDLVKYTDSFCWVDGNGRIVFSRLTEVSSLDYVVHEGAYNNFEIALDADGIVNRQYVDYGYSQTSNYWQYQASAVNSTSVNSFGAHEEVLQFKSISYVNSVDATNTAERKVSRLAFPPKYFSIELPMFGLHRTPGNTIRLVSSFFNVTSAGGWRVNEQNINIDDLSIEVVTHEALVANGFYLDVHFLDGDEVLL